METVAKLSVPILSARISPAPSRRVDPSKEQEGWPLVERALKDYQQIKSASTRAQVEKYFRQDGGLQFPAKVRYVYAKCDYLHVDVEFELARPAKILSLPEDQLSASPSFTFSTRQRTEKGDLRAARENVQVYFRLTFSTSGRLSDEPPTMNV